MEESSYEEVVESLEGGKSKKSLIHIWVSSVVAQNVDNYFFNFMCRFKITFIIISFW